VTTRTASLGWLNTVALRLFEVVLFCASRFRVTDVQHIPAQGPAVVVSNHISMADALVFATTIGRSGRIPTFLGMAEMFRWPVIGPVISRMGHVPVHRGSTSAADSLQPALDVLASGGVVGLYPEGKVTTEPDYRPMRTGKSGAVRLALTAQCPVVPVAQWGAHHLLTRDHESALTRKVRVFGWLRPGRSHRRPRIDVVVGPPISYAELLAAATVPGSSEPDYRAATALVMDRLRGLLAGLDAPDLPDATPDETDAVAA
jgi:1-acyl-sn-glycerol-3-phosphate acyltransferase